MKKTEGFVARYQLPIFFFLTYLLSWWSVPFANGGLLPHGPAFAALIIFALTEGRQGISQLWRRMTNWSTGWWYLIGTAVIVGYQGIAFIINLLLGATVAEAPHLPTLGTFLFLLFMGGQWEELGWTGYALPKIQERFASRTNGALLAALVRSSRSLVRAVRDRHDRVADGDVRDPAVVAEDALAEVLAVDRGVDRDLGAGRPVVLRPPVRRLRAPACRGSTA